MTMWLEKRRFSTLLESRWAYDRKTHRFFLYLMGKANWDSVRYKDITLERGDILATLKELSEESGLTVSEVRTAIKHLKSSGDLKTTRYGRNQIIHLSTYSRYACG